MDLQLHSFLCSALVEGGHSASHPVLFTLVERTPFICNVCNVNTSKTVASGVTAGIHFLTSVTAPSVFCTSAL